MTTNTLIQALSNAELYPHPVHTIEIKETHISWIILTGEFAYKIKKPLNLGFLDFSTLQQRQHFCEQEVLLNQRLAPDTYLQCLAIGGSEQQPQLDGAGPAIEYAVKMRQFQPQQQLDYLADHQQLSSRHIDQLADQIAAFHQQAETADSHSHYGSPPAIQQAAAENFSQIRELYPSAANSALFCRLEQWNQRHSRQLSAFFTLRQQQGRVINAHGDLHLGNITLDNAQILIFDCIEFNEEFRWIDCLNDLAFTLMDLHAHQQPALAHRLLDRYLQRSGDYAGLPALRFYLVYRAMIRAKVALIRAQQPGLSDQQQQACITEFDTYLQLAADSTIVPQPLLILTSGVSGSGKSLLTQPLLEQQGMIRLRSDVERKRLFGLAAEDNSSPQQNIYRPETSQQVYQLLLQQAQQLLQLGYHTIIDATLLLQQQRHPFIALAEQCHCRCLILHFHARPQVLRQWIIERNNAGQDASEATPEVLDKQLAQQQPFNQHEQALLHHFDSEDYQTASKVIELVRQTIAHNV